MSKDAKKLPARPWSGQSTIEFTAFGLVVIALILGTAAIGVAGAQRAAIDYEFSRIGNELPEGWKDMPDEEVIRNIVCENPMLKGIGDEVVIENATVEPDRSYSHTTSDAYSDALGAVMKTDNSERVRISADVSVPLAKGIGIVPMGTYRTHFERTMTVERRFETS